MLESRTFKDLRATFRHLNWAIIVLLGLIAGIGFAVLYSAGDGSFSPWASRQMIRFGVGLVLMLGVAMINIRFWYKHAYNLYIFSFALLLFVELVGVKVMGAQRWINVYAFNLQPSELIKITMVLALARYYHGCTQEQVKLTTFHIPPLLLILLPAILVLRQPDLGTAMLIILVGCTIVFLSGIQLWKVLLVIVSAASSVPILWMFLHEYQKERLLTFLNPERDPFGAGYHILQSKIAFGSGGLWGKGFMNGTQSHLNFLPEKQTDFIFTMFSEEFGLMGGLVLLMLYGMLIAFGYGVSFNCRSIFGRYLAMGITMTVFLYVFINMAMVMGLVPVVGIPLPLLSYGGTSMLTILLGFGLLQSVNLHRDVRLGRSTGG